MAEELQVCLVPSASMGWWAWFLGWGRGECNFGLTLELMPEAQFLEVALLDMRFFGGGRWVVSCLSGSSIMFHYVGQ